VLYPNRAPMQLGYGAANSPRFRFDRVAITSVFGAPNDPHTWSGAPYKLGLALARLGIEVAFIHSGIGWGRRLAFAAKHLAQGCGRPTSTEQILRGAPARERMALKVAKATAALGVRHVLHTGTLDLPPLDLLPGIRHYVYCDQTWDLSLENRPDIADYRASALDEYETCERQALQGVEHAFAFARCVGENLIQHYGLPPSRVSVVGSGMGNIEPYHGPKTYDPPKLLFVAKHLFKAKGGPLLLDAFSMAQERRSDLSLTIVADRASRRLIPRHPTIVFRSGIPWPELQDLYRTSALLVQPMLNDPWGQVYLEALVSRTPVLGLNRNGLPEIVADGQFGFLVDRPTPDAIRDAILDAVADPERLANMGRLGQAHVIATHSWDRVAARICLLPDEGSVMNVG
jgi:glycosyltransferase involved in cell wall biosynthesis